MTGGRAQLDALTSPEGRALLDLLRGVDVSGEAGLRLGTQLRREHPTELVVAALAQQELRTRAATKFSRAADMFFTRAGLEQASAEVVAEHRRARYRGSATIADLCCGIGGDLVALAAEAGIVGVDRDPVHLWMARENARANGVLDRVQTREADVRTVDLSDVDAVFIDPARRSGAGRTRAGASEPPLAWCLGLADTVERVGIKAAPGLDHDLVPAGLGAGVRGRRPRPQRDRAVVTRAGHRRRPDPGHGAAGRAHDDGRAR